MSRIIVISILMALVTFIPRMLPMVLLGNKKLPPFWDSFFHYVPFAVLGALIFPDILSATGDRLGSISGTIVAIILAWRGYNPTVVVFGSIVGAVVTRLV